MRRLLALFVVAITLAPACKDDKDKTKIVVAVWSDLAVPGELDAIRIDASGTEAKAKTFTLTAASAADQSKPLALLMLAPLGEKNAAITVKATGMRNLTDLVSQTARVSFVSGQALLLKLVLARDCQGKTCTPDYICSRGACDQSVAVVALPPYESGKPLTAPDAGVRVDSGAIVDSKGAEPVAFDSGVADAAQLDVGLDAATDVPLPPPGTGGVSGGTGGVTGTGGTTSTGTVAGTGGAVAFDAATADLADAPFGGAGGVIIDGGTGGMTGTGGGGGATGTGGVTGTGGGGGTGMERCVFGTSRFGNCVFGP